MKTNRLIAYLIASIAMLAGLLALTGCTVPRAIIPPPSVIAELDDTTLD